MWLAINLAHCVQAVSSEHDPTRPLWRRFPAHGRHARYVRPSVPTCAHTAAPCRARPSPPLPLPSAGTFVALYKLLLNALPLLLPQPHAKASTHTRERSLFRQSVQRSASRSRGRAAADSPFGDDAAAALDDDAELAMLERGQSPRRARLSLSAQAHQVWVRKRTRRWYSALAGSVAGAVAILCEKRSRRAGIAQQMFVR